MGLAIVEAGKRPGFVDAACLYNHRIDGDAATFPDVCHYLGNVGTDSLRVDVRFYTWRLGDECIDRFCYIGAYIVDRGGLDRISGGGRLVEVYRGNLIL